jgi:leucyl-tRNA synthetase
MILGEMEYTVYVREGGAYVSAEYVSDGVDTRSGAEVEATHVDEDDVVKEGDFFVLQKDTGIRVDARAHKMSKSRGNVINQDEVVDQYGADAFRLYEMFMAPLEQDKPWNTRSVEGTYRFLNRVWRLVVETRTDTLNAAVQAVTPSKEQLRVLHQTIQKVTDDIEGMRFNTAIAAMMEFVNAANKWDVLPSSVIEPFVTLFSPFAPHLAEELWRRLGHDATLAYEPWPEFVEAHLVEDRIEIAVQVNGKVRGTIEVPADADKEAVLGVAKRDDNVARHLDGKTLRREIYVPGRIVNFVAT